VDLLDTWGLKRADYIGTSFAGAVFHTADFKREATSTFKDAAYRTEYSTLVGAMRAAAGESVRCIEGANAVGFKHAEDGLTIKLEAGDTVSARFAIIASGVTPESAGRWRVSCTLKSPNKSKLDRMHWVLGLNHPDAHLAGWAIDTDFILTLDQPGSRDEVNRALEAHLTALLRSGSGTFAKLSRGDGGTSAQPAPATNALESETLVGKRTLTIGDAGGFRAMASREGIYPALWSAKLAAEVVSAACKSDQPQDTLRKFSTKWRSTMAEYLRPPNADMQFLLPLIFTNAKMADKFAAAYFRGENI
jgi:flavin-dependent dehydrogenase